MATVRITNDIRYYVRNKIDTMFRQRIEEKQKELNTLDIGTACYIKYFDAKLRRLAEELNNDPDGYWIEPTTSCSISTTYVAADGNEKTVTFSIDIKPGILIPLRYRGYHNSRFALTEDMGPYQHVKAIWLAIDQLNAEKGLLIASIVDDVLTNCTTLRQVLEVWPTALDFMPDTARAQHYAKTEKRTSPAASVEIADDVKIALMKARMTAGS